MEEFRRGWAAALGCLIGHVVGLHTLPPYTIGLFIGPLQDAFGWSRTSISLGITILTIGLAIGAPVVGLLVDRMGERTLIAFGMLVLAIGYASLSTMTGSLAVFWTTMALMALRVTLVGTGLTGTLAPIVLGPVIAEYGWRAGYQVLSLIMAVSLPIVLG